MFLARVVGSVWSTVKWPQMHGVKLLAVNPYRLSDDTPSPNPDEVVVCADILGAGVGEDVVVAYGHAARVALHDHLGESDLTTHPIDAAIVAIVDQINVPNKKPDC